MSQARETLRLLKEAKALMPKDPDMGAEELLAAFKKAGRPDVFINSDFLMDGDEEIGEVTGEGGRVYRVDVYDNKLARELKRTGAF